MKHDFTSLIHNTYAIYAYFIFLCTYARVYTYMELRIKV